MIQWDTLRRIADKFIEAMDRRTKAELAKADGMYKIAEAIRNK